MASSIATSAAQKLGALLVDEAKYLYQVSDKMKKLQTELLWMVSFLEDADNREHQERLVHMWVSEIREIAYDAEDVIERYLHGVSYHRKGGVMNAMKWASCCIFDSLTLHFVGSSIDELRARISDLIPRMQMYGIRNVGRSEDSKYNIVVKEQRRTYSHTEEDPIGLETQMNELVGQLLHNNNSSVIGISGMGGLGKTTLAREVFTNEAIEKHFQSRRAWIYLSKEFDRKNVFEEILVSLCASEEQDIRNIAEKLKDNELAIKICEVLKTKECFIVIDDMWYTHSWDSLKPAFGSIKGSNSKILITTRDDGLIHHADEGGYSHRSDKLNEEDSWNLFKRKALHKIDEKVSLEVKTTMENMGREMVNHCDGLPLAIVALGGVLATKRTVEEWEIVRKNISSYLMFETVEQSVNGGVPQVLELSYNDLPYYLKPCFLYFGNFPEDYEIESERLYHLWEAEGLVSRANKRTRVEGVSLDDVAESYLNQLVQRSMVEVSKRSPNGRIKSCRLHDIMRDMCIQKCEDVNFLSIVNAGSSDAPPGRIASSSLGHTTLRRCALHFEPKSPWPTLELENSASLRSLLVFFKGYYLGDMSAVFKQLKSKCFSLLRVLDLRGCHDIERLPQAIKWTHMRYLSLRGTNVRVIPQWVFHLEYLETLDLRVWGAILYHDFRKLRRLRHLYLPGVTYVKSLKTFKLSDDQLHQIETLKNFQLEILQENDLVKMINLRIFTFSKCDLRGSIEDGMEMISRSPAISSGHLINHLRMISITAKFINEKPTIMGIVGKYLKGLVIGGRIEADDDVEIFHDNMKSVVLHDCEIGETHLAKLEKLPHLETLELHGKAIRGSKLTFSENAFPHLLVLRIVLMEELEETVVGDGALPNLRTLKFEGCSKLKKLPQGLPNTVCIKLMRVDAHGYRYDQPFFVTV